MRIKAKGQVKVDYFSLQLSTVFQEHIKILGGLRYPGVVGLVIRMNKFPFRVMDLGNLQS